MKDILDCNITISSDNMGKTKDGLIWQLRPVKTIGEEDLGWFAISGYVGLPKGHPYYGRNHGNIDVNAYGGLTFSEEINSHWVIGFDVMYCGQNLSTWGKDRCMQELMNLVKQLQIKEISNDKTMSKMQTEKFN
jgi:hypothetical protein